MNLQDIKNKLMKRVPTSLLVFFAAIAIIVIIMVASPNIGKQSIVSSTNAVINADAQARAVSRVGGAYLTQEGRFRVVQNGTITECTQFLGNNSVTPEQFSGFELYDVNGTGDIRCALIYTQ